MLVPYLSLCLTFTYSSAQKRKTVSASLVALRVASLTLWSIHPATNVSIASAVCSLLSALLIFVLSKYEHTRSVRPSSLICAYLIFTVLFDATQLRTLYLRDEEHVISGVASAALGVEVILLCLEATSKRSSLRGPYKAYPPEATSGIINRSFFWWLNPLFIAGFRKLLSLEDLYVVDDDLCSERLQSRIEASWKHCMVMGPSVDAAQADRKQTGPYRVGAW